MRIGETIDALRYALDNGVNFIDTADVYGFGHAESLLPKALEGRPRDSVMIATKGGLVWDDEGNVTRDNSRKHLTEALHASLQRLKTDYIDLYQVHWPDPKTPVEETMEAMYDFWKAGKIRWIGVSNFDVPLLEASLAVAPVHCLQPQYNMLQRQIEADVLPFCREKGIAVIVYSPWRRACSPASSRKTPSSSKATGAPTGRSSRESSSSRAWRR